MIDANWPQPIDSDGYKRTLRETVGVHPPPTAEDHQRRTHGMLRDPGWWLSLFPFPVLTYLSLSLLSFLFVSFLPSSSSLHRFGSTVTSRAVVNKLVRLVGYRYCASAVLCSSSRITNLFYYLLRFMRGYSICRRVGHPMVFCGQAPRGADSILVYRWAPRRADGIFVIYAGSDRGWRHFLVSKLTLYDSVCMRHTNKYKASAEFWSAVLLSHKGSSQRWTKYKKGVNIDLSNNYHLVFLNIRTWHPLNLIFCLSNFYWC